MPEPIFILGPQRSGTTWLANQLCQHSRIAGIQHVDHHGIHESGYFKFVMGRYGELKRRANYVEFVEVMRASDYFTLAGADADFLYSLYPTTYAGVFRAVMDRYAEQQDADYWVEKTPGHTLYIGELARFYPDARFIYIQRQVEATAASSLARAPETVRQGWLRRRYQLAVIGAIWAYYFTYARRYEKHVRGFTIITYEALRADIETEMKKLSDFLGITYEDNLTQQHYRPDSSHRSDEAREKMLSEGEKAFVRGVARIVGALPFPLVHGIVRLRRWITPRHELPDWFFRLTRASDADEHPLAIADKTNTPETAP